MNVSSSVDWNTYRAQEVVLDLASPYVILGVLTETHGGLMTLTDADVHDLRDSKTTRELYVLAARRHGIRSNRKQVIVRIDEVVSLSRLDDVLE